MLSYVGSFCNNNIVRHVLRHNGKLIVLKTIDTLPTSLKIDLTGCSTAEELIIKNKWNTTTKCEGEPIRLIMMWVDDILRDFVFHGNDQDDDE